ncbi:MAG: hypothetical protein AAF485_27250 [Chloroflexota bacterium]
MDDPKQGSKLKRWSINIAIFIVMLIVMILLAEFAFRLIDGAPG